MEKLWLALIELVRPYITTLGAVLSTILIKDAWKDAEREQKRAEALEARGAAQNHVASLPDGGSHDELLRDWNRDDPRQSLRGNGKSLNIK